jgi:hypothetical protein
MDFPQKKIKSVGSLVSGIDLNQMLGLTDIHEIQIEDK